MDEAFELHNMNNKDILNRMKLFKTRLLFNEDSEQKFNNLPKLFNLEDEENSNTKKEEEKPEPKILTKEEKNKNKTDIFDKDLFYEEMDKLNYENFIKEANKRKIKKEKRINVIKPVLNKILDITEYIYEYQQSINKELIDKFIGFINNLKEKNVLKLTNNNSVNFLFPEDSLNNLVNNPNKTIITLIIGKLSAIIIIIFL